MNTNGVPVPWVDTSEYNENRANYPPDLLIPYAGQHVAWSLDGRRILMSGESMEDVDKKLVAVGIDPRRVVFGYIDEFK
jgi:hypothetical protein